MNVASNPACAALDSALAMASKGYRVFPLPPRSKKAALADWPSLASTDEEQIKKWNGAGSNWAMVLDDKIAVVDEDGPDGSAILAKFEAEHGGLPPTWTVKTARGRHRLYGQSLPPAPHDARPKDLELRAGTHYIVLPGSVHPSGHIYEWEVSPDEAPLADLPEWLHKGWPGSRVSEKPVSNIIDFPSWILPKHAGLGVSSDEADLPRKATLSEIKSALAAISPDCSYDDWLHVGAALYDELGDDGEELFVKWSQWSRAKYPKGESPEKKWPQCRKLTNWTIGTVFYMATEADPNWRDGMEEPEQPKAEPGISPIELVWPGETAETDADWLVKHRIEKTGTGILSARSGEGKTFTALDLAFTLARLKTWTGQKVTENVGTLWIAAESPGQIQKRMRGLPEEPGDWPFVYIKSCPKLLDARGRTNTLAINQLVAVWSAANEQMLERHGVRIGLIIIDTMLRVSGYRQSGENDPSQGGAVWDGLSALSEATGTFVLGVDHMGLAAVRTRGNTAKEDFVDFVAYLDDGEMLIDKVRNGPDMIAIPFQLETIVLGQDRDGDDVTTKRVVWGEPGASASKAKGKKLPESTRLLLEAMTTVKEWPTPVDALRLAHKRLYKAADKTAEHERNAWSKATKAYKLRFFDRDGLPMVDEPPL